MYEITCINNNVDGNFKLTLFLNQPILFQIYAYLPGGKGDSWTKYEALAANDEYEKFRQLISSIQRSTKCMILEWVN